MTRLDPTGKMILEELQRRNYSQTTVILLISALVHAEETGRPQCRPSYGGAGFFSCKTLKRAYPVEEVPYPKAPRRLATNLIHEEAARLINSASNLFRRANAGTHLICSRGRCGGVVSSRCEGGEKR